MIHGWPELLQLRNLFSTEARMRGDADEERGRNLRELQDKQEHITSQTRTARFAVTALFWQVRLGYSERAQRV
jgi:hypothetical protein